MKAVALALLALAPAAFALTEQQIAEPWCEARHGRSEVMLPDRTRVDCLLPRIAVEADWAHKWAEAIGQSLHYARLTHREPGVLLILKREEDRRYVLRVREAAIRWTLPITVWVVESFPR